MTVHETALRRGASAFAFAFLAAITSFSPTAAFADANHPLLADGKAILNFHGSLPLAVRKGFTDKEQADFMIGDRVGGFIADKSSSDDSITGPGLNVRLAKISSAPQGFKYPRESYNTMVVMTGVIPPAQNIDKPIKVCIEYQGEIRGIFDVDQRTGDVKTLSTSLAKSPTTEKGATFAWACKSALWPYYAELKKASQTADGAISSQQ
jgi:hypothetical protein